MSTLMFSLYVIFVMEEIGLCTNTSTCYKIILLNNIPIHLLFTTSLKLCMHTCLKSATSVASNEIIQIEFILFHDAQIENHLSVTDSIHPQ